MLDWNVVAAWAGAITALVAAFITVWWPWHTRLSAQIEYEAGVVVPIPESDRFAQLTVQSGLQRARTFIRVRNDGDGSAYALALESDGRVTVRFLEIADRMSWSERLPMLGPGREVIIVVLPMNEDRVAEPDIALRWKESPIRLRRSRKRMPLRLHDGVPGKRPLEFPERAAVRAYLHRRAVEHGVEARTFVEDVLGLDWEAIQ